MTVKTLVPSDKVQARKAENQVTKKNGAASPFQGILRKEMEKGRPVAKAPAGKDKGNLSNLQPVKDDGKAKPPQLVQLKESVKKPQDRELSISDGSNTVNIPAVALMVQNPQTPVADPTQGKKPPESTKTLVKSLDTEGDSSKDVQSKKKSRPGDLNALGVLTAPQGPKVIQVVDRRRGGGEKEMEIKSTGSTAVNNSSTTGSKSQGQQELTIHYTSTQGFSSEGSGAPIQAPVTRAAADGLFRNLQDKANVEIVDKAKIILKDHGQGEIRLIIKPESLGEVKIRLNLEDGRLAGQIIVENNTVKEIFQNNMNSLLDSFRQGGFTGLDIQVSVGGEGSAQDFRERSALLNSYSQGVSLEPAAEDLVSRGPSHYWQSGQLDLVV